jgi:hypothetical protein
VSAFERLQSRWPLQRKRKPPEPWRILPMLPATGWSDLGKDAIERYLIWHVATSSHADKSAGACWVMEPEWYQLLIKMTAEAAAIEHCEPSVYLYGMRATPRHGAGAPHLEARGI